MASTLIPNTYTYLAGGAIPKGSAVKMGADRKHVVVATAATDLMIGIAQTPSTLAEDPIELAHNGGGAKGLAGGTIAAGARLTSNGAGALISTTTQGDVTVGTALESAVAGDFFSVQMGIGTL